MQRKGMSDECHLLCMATPSPTAMTHGAISVDAMMQTAGGMTSWLRKSAG